MVNPEIRDKVPDKHIAPTELLNTEVKNGAHDRHTEVAHPDPFHIPLLIQRTLRVEVVDTTEQAILITLATALTLRFMVVVAGDIGEKVHLPTTKLLQ